MFDSKMKYFVFLTLLCYTYVSGQVPSYIKICSKNDNLKQCLTDNFQFVLDNVDKNGDSSVKLQPLNKIHVENQQLQAAKELLMILKSIDFFGLEKAKLVDILIDNNELRLNILVPRLEIVGNCELKGTLLSRPLEGIGRMNITYVNLIYDYKAKLKTEERDGKSYFYVENNFNDTQTSVTVTRGYVKFYDFKGGDPKRELEMNAYLEEKWKDVYDEFRAAIEKVTAFILMNPIINAYLRRIPIDQLFT